MSETRSASNDARLTTAAALADLTRTKARKNTDTSHDLAEGLAEALETVIRQFSDPDHVVRAGYEFYGWDVPSDTNGGVSDTPAWSGQPYSEYDALGGPRGGYYYVTVRRNRLSDHEQNVLGALAHHLDLHVLSNGGGVTLVPSQDTAQQFSGL